jgi:DNA-binding CsgD family transcriptional regulator/tetratricopeptide (TPR) repeat protein
MPRAGSLLERDRELAAFRSLIDGARSGAGRVALIEGRAGIGKSRLLSELREQAAAEGLQVLTARGSELEREFPYGVVRQLFEPRLHGPSGDGDLLAGAAGAARPVFTGVQEDAGDASFAALHGLYWLSVNLAEDGPALVAIDDLHWCDRASLRFVAYLVHRLEGLPVLIGASLRTGEPGTDQALVADISGDPATVAVHPGALSRAGVAQLVGELLGAGADAAFVSACHEATGGNPLLLRQLLSSLAAERVSPRASNAQVVRDLGPRAVSRTVLVRLARLPQAAVAVAQAVAVLGESAHLPVAAALAQVPEDTAADATAALARAEILRPDPPLGFVHPLVREAVYRELPAGQRELQHSRAAAILREAGATAEQIAAQLLVSPRRGDEATVDLLLDAGHAALRKAAPESAVAYLERALDEPPPLERQASIRLELGLAEVRRSGPAAAGHLRAAYEGLAEPTLRGTAAFALAHTLLFAEGPDETRAIARQAASELPPDQLDMRRRLEALELITVNFGGADSELEPALARFREEQPERGLGASRMTAIAAHRWALAGEPADACVELSKRALADGSLIDEDDGLFFVAAVYPLAIADRSEALEAWDMLLAQAHVRGSLFTVLTAHLFRGQTMFLRGELAEAEESIALAIEESELWGLEERALGYATAFYAEALLELGKVDSARRVLEDWPAPSGHADGMNYIRRALVELRLLEGRNEEALALVDEYSRELKRVANPADGPWRSLKAQALERLGRSAEARELVEQELVLARRWGAPATVGRTLRVLGALEREAGINRLREAVEVLERSPAKLELAKAHAALGGALRRARKPTEAREPLRKALELAEICGAAGLVDDVRAELKAAGVRPRTTALSGPGSLTASEQRVAQLAAEGRTNSEVAQTLFVTPKTVEVHLTNVYRKLGIGSRKQLPQALGAP